MKNKSKMYLVIGKIMRITFTHITIALMFSGISYASETLSQEILNKKVTVEAKLVTLKEALTLIEQNTGVKFGYSVDFVQLDETVSLQAKTQKLKVVLDKLLNPLNLKYHVIDEQILVTRYKLDLEIPEINVDNLIFQQIVSGKVIGETGEALPGVNVVVKGTTNGTATDTNGNYSLEVPDEGVTLVFSFIGYQPQEVEVGNRSTINVTLEPDIQSLQEVVIVGYGTQRKGDLTGSTGGISAAQIEMTPITTVEQSIQGRVTGVQVTTANAAPGGGVSFKIRGTNSITGNSEPLYVIDGVPIISNNNNATPGGIGGEGERFDSQNALATLNPNDIESIQILKDASASAIYGARGANGVVIITTKKGKLGKPQISFDSYFGIQSITHKTDAASPDEYVTALREAYTNAGQPLPVSEAELSALLSNPVDYQDLVLRDPSESSIYNLQVSLSGATPDDLNYYLSLNNFKQNGIIRGSGFERSSVRVNIEKGTEKFRAGTNFTFSTTESDLITSGNLTGIIRYAITGSPIQPIYDENGEYLHSPVLVGGTTVNPESLFNGGSDILTSNRVLGSIFAEYRILEPLTFRSTLGIDIDDRNRKTYYDRTTGPRYGGTANPGYAEVANAGNTQIVTTNTLNYEPRLEGNHRLNITGVFEAQTFDYNSMVVRNRNFSSDVLGADGIASGQQPGGPTLFYNAYKWQLASWVGRVFYSFDDKYLLNATVRYDGSSRFGENNRWGTFPSIGVAWKVSNENFLNDIEVIDQLKIRASYGITGNQEIGVLRTAERYVPTLGAIFGNVTTTTVNAVSFANPDLKWEESTQVNVGVDASFLENRLNFTFDLYKRTTTDLLLEVNIAPSSGFSAPIFNVGEIQNQGIELALHGSPIVTENFEWNLGVNFSRNRNEVLKILSERAFYGLEAGLRTEPTLLQEGLPVGVFFGYKTNGVYATDAEADADVTDGSLFLKEAGEFRYVDINNDNRIDADDRTVMGDPNPDFIYGITSSIKYKNFSLDLLFQGVQGNDILWGDAQVFYGSGRVDASNISQERFNGRWTPENTQAQYPKFQLGTDVDRTLDDRLVFDGSYFRLRDISFAYEFPSSLLEKMKLQRLRVYVSGSNLLTFTDYPGFNPDVSTLGQNTVSSGIDLSAYPLAKTYQFGLNITF